MDTRTCERSALWTSCRTSRWVEPSPAALKLAFPSQNQASQKQDTELRKKKQGLYTSDIFKLPCIHLFPSQELSTIVPEPKVWLSQRSFPLQQHRRRPQLHDSQLPHSQVLLAARSFQGAHLWPRGEPQALPLPRPSPPSRGRKRLKPRGLPSERKRSPIRQKLS